MVRSRKGKEIARGSGPDHVPPPHLPSGETLRSGGSATPTSATEDISTHPAAGSSVQDTSTGSSGSFHIRPSGLQFTHQLDCAHHLAHIIEQYYDKPYKSWTVIPREVRDMWFEEWGKRYTWAPEDQLQVRRNFERLGSKRVKNKLHRARSSGIRPGWIGKEDWEQLLVIWSNEEFEKESQQNKKNRASNADGQGFPLHIGGCVSFGEHVERMTRELGHEPTIGESFRRTHTSKNSDGERVWVNDWARTTHETHTQKMNELSSQSSNNDGGENETPARREIVVWTEVVGPPKNGHMRGLGMTCSFSARSTSSPSASWAAPPQWQEERREMMQKNTQLEVEVSRLNQTQNSMLDDFKKMQAWMMQQHQQQMMQQQAGGSFSYYPPPTCPPNLNFSSFMPTPKFNVTAPNNPNDNAESDGDDDGDDEGDV